jgi:hypothetical protein
MVDGGPNVSAVADTIWRYELGLHSAISGAVPPHMPHSGLNACPSPRPARSTLSVCLHLLFGLPPPAVHALPLRGVLAQRSGVSFRGHPIVNLRVRISAGYVTYLVDGSTPPATRTPITTEHRLIRCPGKSSRRECVMGGIFANCPAEIRTRMLGRRRAAGACCRRSTKPPESGPEKVSAGERPFQRGPLRRLTTARPPDGDRATSTISVGARAWASICFGGARRSLGSRGG